MAHRVPVPAQTVAESGETNAYVVGTTDGLLVDPATRTSALDEAVESADVDHVAVTHHHPDHVGAVDAYAREYDLTVWSRAGRDDAFERATGRRPDRHFSPGDTIPVSDGIDVLGLPGHAVEHVGFHTHEGIFCGDVVVTEGSVVVAPPEGDMRAYVTSLRRLYARNPPRLFPGHGPVIEDARAVCERLLAHRHERERLVRTAVQQGHTDPDALVAATYEKDVSSVYDLARGTVIAHLEKLAVEGAVSWDGERATPGENAP